LKNYVVCHSREWLLCLHGFSGLCAQVLEKVKATGNVTIGEYPLYFIPFDEDILSLELDRSFKVPALLLCGPFSRFPSIRTIFDLSGSNGRWPLFFFLGN
jgi:hypothetical protein